jgi:3-deoxy-D-manno-octulosonic-acid transferase
MNERSARVLYTAAWWLAAPLVALYLLWRSVRQAEYRQYWRERFLGHGAAWPVESETIWLHAVSVGETRAAQPLLEQLAQARPHSRFVLTHMTPTGRAVGEAIAAALPGRVRVRYLPYEYPFALRRFFSQLRPRLGIVMETEVWPNLLFAAREAGVPMVLANARLSERSRARAQRFGTLLRAAAKAFVRILAQTEADRERLAQLYDGAIEVTGSMKFDHSPDAALVARGRSRRGDRPVILLASSRDGEEALLLDALPKELEPDPIFWIVPRHPQRFNEVRHLIQKKMGSGSIFLGDTMGEMAMYYALADVTLMGGSFLPFGSQNLIESCAVGTPVILGPSTFNFSQAAQNAVAAGAALQVATMTEALSAALALLADADRLAAMRTAALAFAHAHRGATARTVAVLTNLLDETNAGDSGVANASAVR